MNDHANSAGSAGEQPAIELIEGISPIAQQISPAAKLVRFALYGMTSIFATTFIALTVVPETSAYLPFIPEAPLPQLDPEVLAAVIAQQQAYLQSECVTGVPHTPRPDESAASEGIFETLIDGETAGPAAAIRRDSELPVPSNSPDDAGPSESATSQDASLPAQ
ncbi:MAG: hypothetical protein AB7U20_06760 [Planctomycetaceae bacterium]